ncbi:hypothetical protein V8F20_004495 [Naviculisporaceae sp. PSN 640]
MWRLLVESLFGLVAQVSSCPGLKQFSNSCSGKLEACQVSIVVDSGSRSSSSGSHRHWTCKDRVMRVTPQN